MAKSVKVGDWILSVFSSYEEGKTIKVKEVRLDGCARIPNSGVTQT